MNKPVVPTKIKAGFPYAGGKQKTIGGLVKYTPTVYNTYYEPFAGALSMLLALQPKLTQNNKAVVSDINRDVIRIFTQLKNNQTAFLQRLQEQQDILNTKTTKYDREVYYYSVRDRFNRNVYTNNTTVDLCMATDFYILIVLSFGSLIRYNIDNGVISTYGAGLTIGRFKQILTTKRINNLTNIGSYLKTNDVTITNKHFKEALQDAKEGDFIYLDPPYYNRTPNKVKQFKYKGFTKQNFDDLLDEFKRLDSLGAYVMMSNYYTDELVDLYDGYKIIPFIKKRDLQSNNKTVDVTECVVLNYNY